MKIRSILFAIIGLTLLSCKTPTTFKERVPGVYKIGFIVQSTTLHIQTKGMFTIQNTANVISAHNMDSGRWDIHKDTLFLYFEDTSQKPVVHIIESPFRIRGNPNKTLMTKDSFSLEAPAYLYKIKAFYPNGQLKAKYSWSDIGYTLDPQPAQRDGVWQYFYKNGHLKKEEIYESGKLISTKKHPKQK